MNDTDHFYEIFFRVVASICKIIIIAIILIYTISNPDIINNVSDTDILILLILAYLAMDTLKD